MHIFLFIYAISTFRDVLYTKLQHIYNIFKLKSCMHMYIYVCIPFIYTHSGFYITLFPYLHLCQWYFYLFILLAFL